MITTELNSVINPGSVESGEPEILEACPQDFLVNFSQLWGLFKVFGENRRACARCAPPPLLDPPLKILAAMGIVWVYL